MRPGSRPGSPGRSASGSARIRAPAGWPQCPRATDRPVPLMDGSASISAPCRPPVPPPCRSGHGGAPRPSAAPARAL
jgi:hypothetical protein